MSIRSFLLKLWELTRLYRTRLFLGVVTGIIAGLLEPLVIGVFTAVYGLIFSDSQKPIERHIKGLPQFIDERIPVAAWDWLDHARQAVATHAHNHPGAIIALVAAIPAFVFLRGLFTYFNIYFLQWAAIRAVTDLRNQLFAHLMGLSAGFFNASKTGELMSRLVNDTITLQSIITTTVSTAIKDPVTLLGLLALLLWKQPMLTLISMVVMPLCVIPIVIYGRKVRRSAGNMQNHLAELSNIMSESFTGNKIIKAYNLVDTVVEQFREAARKLVGQTMRIVRAMEIPGPLLEFCGSVGVGLVFLFVAFHGGAQPADFLTVLLALFSMYRPIKNIARLQSNLQQARAASERVFDLLATRSTVLEPLHPKPLKAAGADIQFKDIEFAYGEKPVIRGINLTVKAGQFVALVGSTGSGKTTLISLLLRFYDPQRGTVLIGDTDIREVLTRDLRDQIAVVTQETILFDASIRRNIELGRPGATDAEIEDAARHAHVLEFTKEKQQGFDFVIGERGSKLSGGQRQRIAIARAILKNAPILILDEATSSLDAEVERIVQTALEELMQGRTTICIAHRLSTIQRADLIVVLDQGHIVELGRHTELLSQNGVYRRLYELHFQSEDEDESEDEGEDDKEESQ